MLEAEVASRGIRGVLMDVDGTLLPQRSEELPTLRVIEAVRATGLIAPTGLASARQRQKTDYLMGPLELSGFSSLSNGGQIVNNRTRETMVEHVLDFDTVWQLSNELQERGVKFWVQDNGVDRHDYDLESYRPEKPFILVAHKVDEHTAKELAETVKRYPNMVAFRAHQFEDGTLEVFLTRPDTNKQRAVEHIAELIDARPEEILVIGDGLNDRDMFRVGFGVAMGNAHDELKPMARLVVPSQEEDGVAVALETLILMRPGQQYEIRPTPPSF